MSAEGPAADLDTGTQVEIGSAEQAALSAASIALQLPVSSAQLAAMLSYLALLRRWNATFNLTAIRDPRAMVTQHLVDCLAACAAMRPMLSPATGTAESLRILDVGSGGGLPGVVLAIMNPGWSVTCIDAVAKKAAFVRQVAGTLPLHNLHAEHGRVELWRGAPFDLIAARAFASLAHLARLTRPLLAPGGRWMAMKGQTPQAEVDALPPEVEAFHVEQLTVPELDAHRCLVWMRLRRDT